MNAEMRGGSASRSSKTVHVQISVHTLQTPPENDEVYGRIDPADPEVVELAKSIAKQGVLEPLVVSADGFVLSGNRRLCAARMAGLEDVPCRAVNVRRGDANFMTLLVAHNAQRVKRIDQVARELSVTIDPLTAHRRLVESRKIGSEVFAETFELGAVKGRSAIKGNRPIADAALKIIYELRPYWPLSDRGIHYQLLNAPPKMHVSKRGLYHNHPDCYRTLTDVLARLRVSGELPFEAIADETRPVTTWDVHQHSGAFLRREVDGFLKGYWRDLQQSQPNHIEVIVEKLTLQSILSPIVSEFTVPMTVGRGSCSLPPRWAIAERFKKSGKEKLVLVLMSDMDPSGMTISESFGRSMRDDFHIPEEQLVCVKAALNMEQILELKLPEGAMAKAKSPTTPEYVRRYGRHVWELEAVPPAKLKEILRESLMSVMDMERFNAEQRRELSDAVDLEGYRTAVLQTFDHVQILPEGGAL
jgi:hypothetical protein